VGSSDALKHDIHIWIGSESTQDEYGTAAYKMVEADDYLGGAPVQHRQVEGHEAIEFSKIFEALEYLDGGVESGFNKVEPTPDKPLFFHVKGTRSQTMKMSQIPMSVASMNEGDSFILYVSKSQVWVWHGKDVSIDLRSHSTELMNMLLRDYLMVVGIIHGVIALESGFHHKYICSTCCCVTSSSKKL
jgi:gelsolin